MLLAWAFQLLTQQMLLAKVQLLAQQTVAQQLLLLAAAQLLAQRLRPQMLQVLLWAEQTLAQTMLLAQLLVEYVRSSPLLAH